MNHKTEMKEVAPLTHIYFRDERSRPFNTYLCM